MAVESPLLLLLLLWLWCCSSSSSSSSALSLASSESAAVAAGAAHNVTYDRRSLIIDGQRKLLLSASIHYPRSVPAMWPGLVQTAKEGGIDVIETYVFWNGHELSPDNYYFGGRFDLVKFVKIVQQAGMYLILRIGPFVAAEWNFGGVPVWLHYVPGTVFRTDNEPFKHYMQKFMTFIVNLMKQEKLFASQGGPIILAQVENEYGDTERFYGDGGKPYAMWAARMALSQNIGVPWIMCQQYDAPDPVVDVYEEPSGACAAFISNMDDKNDTVIEFRNMSYHLPAWSVSILPDCKNVVFNTAKVASQTSKIEMVPNKDFKGLQWEVFVEKAGISGEADFVRNGLVDHINTTKDTTDYLWYTTSIHVDENEEFLKKGAQSMLVVESKGHALHAFVNQKLQTSASGNGSVSPFRFWTPISLKAGNNEIALLSMTVGLQNAGPLYEWVGAGLASVQIEGFNNGPKDLSTHAWTYKIGLEGEHLGLYKADGLNSVKWISTSEPPKEQPLTWYKVVVDAPAGHEPIGLDMIHMGKGLAWLNGEEIGRYWPRKSSKDDECVQQCDYRGKFSPNKCSTGCGEPTQRWYHVPRSWFKPSGNILVIFEEKGGDPTKIRLSKRKTSGVCAFVSEDYPSWSESLPNDEIGDYKSNAAVQLKCPIDTRISTVKFASLGTPKGSCGSYSTGDCHDPSSTSVVEKVCLNKTECTIELTEESFSKGLCAGTPKRLAVEVVCS